MSEICDGFLVSPCKDSLAWVCIRGLRALRTPLYCRRLWTLPPILHKHEILRAPALNNWFPSIWIVTRPPLRTALSQIENSQPERERQKCSKTHRNGLIRSVIMNPAAGFLPSCSFSVSSVAFRYGACDIFKTSGWVFSVVYISKLGQNTGVGFALQCGSDFRKSGLVSSTLYPT